MEDSFEQFEVNVYDPETDRVFNLNVSQEDFQKAQNDMEFVQRLVQHAKSVDKENIPEDSNRNSNTNLVDDLNVDNSFDSTPERHYWGYDETVILIQSMESHMENLNHPKKRKYVFENVSNDLLSQGFKVAPNTAQVKWKTLVRSYKSAKDIRNKSGRGPSRFHFFDMMENLLGSKPSNKCDHSLESINLASTSMESIAVEGSEENTEEELPITPQQKRKRETKQTLSEIKKIEYQRREERHKELCDLNKRKIEIEERKLNLLEKLYEKL